MRTNSQHTSLPHDGDIHDDDIAWLSRRRTGVRGRTLRRVAVGAFSLTFVLAGQSVARADDGWDHSAGHSWGDHWSGDSWGHRWNGEGAPTAAEAAAPAVAPAPAAVAAPAPAAVPAADLTGKPTPTSTAYSAWAPHVRPVVAEIVQDFGVSTVYTRPGHSPTEELAADFMVYSDGATGDAVAQFVIDNAARLNVEYVIWKQRIYIIGSSGWKAMEDRGSPTANHMDHVHVSFTP